jgi:hypothetical protein
LSRSRRFGSQAIGVPTEELRLYGVGTSAVEIIMLALIGDGDANKVSRGLITSESEYKVGVATGTHKDGKTMAVIDYAVGY